MHASPLALLFVLLMGAASLPAKAQWLTPEEARAQELRVVRASQEVNQGDTKAQVIEIAGQPGTIEAATDTTDETWVYFTPPHITVRISFKGDTVSDRLTMMF